MTIIWTKIDILSSGRKNKGEAKQYCVAYIQDNVLGHWKYKVYPKSLGLIAKKNREVTLQVCR